MDAAQRHRELRNKTIPGLFLERVSRTPNEVAYRAKKLGIYEERTWSDFRQRVARCAMGLIELGLKRGEHLALMGDPCEEYVICELAAQTMGAIPYGIYPNCSPGEFHYLLKDGNACMFIAEGQESLDRILPVLNNLPGLRQIIVIDTMGMFGVEHPSVRSYGKLLQSGEKQLASNPGAFEEMVNRIKSSDPLFIVYTSGTTGNPKGVLISHGKHLAAAYTWIDHYPILAESPHRTVAHIPLSHFLGKVVSITLPLLTKIIPHYGEDIEDFGQTMFEVAPTVLFVMPKYLQKLASRLFVGIETSSPFKKAIYKTALRMGRRHLKNVSDGKDNFMSRLSYSISYQAAFRPILNKLGFNRLKIAFSTGAPLPQDIMTFWQICGMNLIEFYGTTETGGAIVCGQMPYFPHPGNVGRPSPGWEVTLSDCGEVLVRGNDLFEGYWNNSESKSNVVEQDGWFHTGDAGGWGPDGALRLLGRPQDFIVVPGGQRIYPTPVENKLRASPYISEVMVFGHHRETLSCLIEIDFESVSDWANRNHLLFTGYTSLIEHPEVTRFIGAEIEKINQLSSPHERVRDFRILPKELNPDEEGGAVTPTRKIKRDVVYHKYKDLIESMVHRGESMDKHLK